jgi:L-fucose isomerase-like protein
MQELLDVLAVTPQRETSEQPMKGAYQIYDALKVIVERHRLQGFTIRCFDLLTSVHNTGCLALAQLNAEGIVAGCEGDVPAMLTMKISQSLIGVSGFQANPASINPETGEMLFAHCTIPFNMVERYELDTHFESGIGVGIRGYMKEGPVTIFKVSGNLTRYFIEEGELVCNQSNPDLCRTQQVIRLSHPSQASYFLTNPIGNHHIILPGHHHDLLKEWLRGNG